MFIRLWEVCTIGVFRAISGCRGVFIRVLVGSLGVYRAVSGCIGVFVCIYLWVCFEVCTGVYMALYLSVFVGSVGVCMTVPGCRGYFRDIYRGCRCLYGRCGVQRVF